MSDVRVAMTLLSAHSVCVSPPQGSRRGDVVINFSSHDSYVSVGVQIPYH